MTRSVSVPDATSRPRSTPGSRPQPSGGVHQRVPIQDDVIRLRMAGVALVVAATVGRLVEQAGIRGVDGHVVDAELVATGPLDLVAQGVELDDHGAVVGQQQPDPGRTRPVDGLEQGPPQVRRDRVVEMGGGRPDAVEVAGEIADPRLLR